MDYRHLVSSTNTNFSINDHLIECGDTTWQIRNIAATSVGKHALQHNLPEPKFNLSKPTLNLKFARMLWVAIVTWITVRLLSTSNDLALWGAAIGAGFVLTLALRNLNARNAKWQTARSEVAREWEIWDEMRRNPPIIYSLMLETNAGSRPLFYSFDDSQIERANTAIKRSMEKKEGGHVSFQIETVNLGGKDSINNFGSSIYHQAIQEKK